MPSFTGIWEIDNARSDGLEPLLEALQLSWLWRKLALSLDIVSTVRHDVSRREVYTEDRNRGLFGITLHSATHKLDGSVESVTHQGYTAHISVTAVQLPGPIDVERGCLTHDRDAAGAFGHMRITAVLPEGMGTIQDDRYIIDGGRHVRQVITFQPRGDAAPAAPVVTRRTLRNMAHDEEAFAESVERMLDEMRTAGGATAAAATAGAGAPAATA